jgi:glycosyltransferase involved in cell wall biosynthesis
MVINDLCSGGAQRVFSLLANSWADSGRTVYVISIDGTEDDFFELSKNVKHIVLDIKGPTKSVLKLNGLYMTLKRIIVLRKTIKRISPQVVLSFLGVINILTILATIRLNTRLVISERNDPALDRLGFGWGFLRTTLYRYADVVSANSKGALNTLKKYVPEHKLRFVPNPILLEDKTAEYGSRQNKILAVGSMRHQKAYDVLLKACAIVFQQEPDWNLTIVGDGELKIQLRELAKELEVFDKVNWAGRTDPVPYYNTARIFVQATRHEGTPNALLEAMSYRLPVIVSDASPGPLEYIKNEENGLVVPVEDAEALAKAVLDLINNEDRRENFSSASAGLLDANKLENAIPEWNRALGW